MGKEISESVKWLERLAKIEITDPERFDKRISSLLEACGRLPPAPKSRRVDMALYGLAVLYVEATGKLPGYSNSENTTHFERFAQAALNGPTLRATSSTIKAGLRRLKLKKNTGFSIDVRRVTGVDMTGIPVK